MRDTLYLRLPGGHIEPDTEVTWLVTGSDGSPGRESTAALSSLAAQSAGKRCVVFATAADMLITRAEVPGSGQTLRRALPWALEEKLAEDVDQLQFATGKRQGTAVPAIVLRRNLLEHWLTVLQQAGLQPAAVHADVQALPLSDEADGVMLIEAEQALIQLRDADDLACDPELVPLLLQQTVVAESLTLPATLDVLVAPDANSTATETLLGQLAQDGFKLNNAAATGQADSVLPVLVRNLGSGKAINLLQGDFAGQAGAAALFKPWRLALALLLLTMLAAGTARALELRAATQQSAALADNIAKLFETAMPGSRRVPGSERLLMEQALRAARGADAAAGGFANVLQLSAPTIHTVDGIKIIGFNWRNEGMEWRLEADKVQTVDALRQALSKQAGIDAEVQSVDAQGGKVDIRLRITEAANNA